MKFFDLLVQIMFIILKLMTTKLHYW